MSLAAELLAIGESEAVLTYFKLCAVFWEEHTLKYWAKAVENGKTPGWLMSLR